MRGRHRRDLRSRLARRPGRTKEKCNETSGPAGVKRTTGGEVRRQGHPLPTPHSLDLPIPQPRPPRPNKVTTRAADDCKSRGSGPPAGDDVGPQVHARLLQVHVGLYAPPPFDRPVHARLYRLRGEGPDGSPPRDHGPRLTMTKRVCSQSFTLFSTLHPALEDPYDWTCLSIIKTSKDTQDRVSRRP